MTKAIVITVSDIFLPVASPVAGVGDVVVVAVVLGDDEDGETCVVGVEDGDGVETGIVFTPDDIIRLLDAGLCADVVFVES